MRILSGLVISLFCLFLISSFSSVAFSQHSINRAKLDQFVRKNELHHTDALVIYRGDQLVGEWYFGKNPEKIQIISATKSVVALAIMKLLSDNVIKSLDQPVFKFFPEWNQGNKKKVTVRHLLNHTSGIQENWDELGVAPDELKLALAAELSTLPGARFKYNSKAASILGGIVEKASGMRLDYYLRSKIFVPLGIRDVSWIDDSTGNPNAAGGLEIRAKDLAKVGQMILNKGAVGKNQIIKKRLIAEMLGEGQKYNAKSGFLWWRYPKRTDFIIAPSVIKNLTDIFPKKKTQLMSLGNVRKSSESEWVLKLDRLLGTKWRNRLPADFQNKEIIKKKVSKEIIGYYASGFLGQYLFVVPEKKLVVVRLVNKWKKPDREKAWYDAFFKDVIALLN